MKLQIALTAFVVTLTASAAVPLPWTVETSRVQPASFDAYHGEALEFIASFNTLGKPLALDSHTATLYYQTNGMDQAWWSVPASVSGNVARATFTPAMDPRAPRIVVFLGVSAGPSNLNYRATANVRFINSPGASPGWIEPPVVKLDFSQIETLNAPWFSKDESNGRYYTKTETNTRIATATNGLESAAHAAQTYQVKGQYLTSESDPTVDGKIEAHDESSSAHGDIRTAIAGKQSTISDLASIRSGAALGATAVQPAAIADMETQTHAAATYQPKGSYLTAETDPTVPSWSKATSKPSYTWAEIGSRPTIPTDSTVSGWGYLKTESDPTVAATIAPIETTVNAWQTYWDGDDVRVTVTNYYGSLDLPSLYLEQKITEGGTNYYKTIWTEKAMLNVILDRLAQLKADVDTKADRAWGFYDSHTGEYAPDGFTSISSGAILVSKDMSYQKTVTTGGGEVWVLTANDPTVITGTETNGFFRITDSEGNNVFEVVKGDKRVVPATTSAVAAGNNSLTITYNVVSQEHPSIEICDDLVEQDWKAEDDAGCPATVVWGGSSGAYVATVTGRQAMSKMFVKGSYEIGGETYIRNGAPVAFEKVILGGVTYRVTVETVNNKKLMVLTEL